MGWNICVVSILFFELLRESNIRVTSTLFFTATWELRDLVRQESICECRRCDITYGICIGEPTT